MSGFTTQALEKKLIDLNNSQQSIQTLSLWLIHHRKHHKPIVQTWFKELKKVKVGRRLTFMYLANDVIQNSRKKGPEFSKEFGAVLKASFEIVAKESDDKTLASLERILSIWETRCIYESNQINSFKASLVLRKQTQQSVKELNKELNNNSNNNIAIESSAKPKDREKEKERVKEDKEKRAEHHKKEHKSSKESKTEKRAEKESKKESKKRLLENSKDGTPSKKRTTDEPKKTSVVMSGQNQLKQSIAKTVDKKTTPVGSAVPNSGGPAVDPEVLIKALQELESSASADAGVRQKIASLPTEVFDATLLDKIRDKGAADRLTKLVDEARSLLADYNSRLSQELEDRKNISIILSNYTQNQRNALSVAEQKLNEYKEKLRKVTQVRNELKSHLQNLPDLSRLPSVTGLAPLPSACDLFNVVRNTSAGSVSSSVSPNESNASPVDYGTPGSNTS